MSRIYNVGGLLVIESELFSAKAYLREVCREELFDAIRKEIPDCAGTIRTHVTFQDSEMVIGTFETTTGKTGSFSYLKSIAPCPVVTVY